MEINSIYNIIDIPFNLEYPIENSVKEYAIVKTSTAEDLEKNKGRYIDIYA